MANTHQDPSLKYQLRIAHEMYERIRLINLGLEKRIEQYAADAKHMQDLANAKDETIREKNRTIWELREKLKVTVK